MPAWLKRNGRRLLLWAAILVIGVPVVLAALYRFVPPPVTPLMLLRLIEGEGLDHRWVPLDAIAPDLLRAVIAAEDSKFCTHHGFDWDAIDNAIDRYEDGGHILGASTISMQTAKNVFLWPGRTFLRKGVEAGLTVLIETLWGKRRIIEVYLNVIEWGHGIYGAEAAARHYFGKPASALNRHEAAALAAVLPSPLHWSPAKPSRHVTARIRIVAARLGQVALIPERVCH
jgi:monofunctional biosynthetic peptidoglycan transglycosylase